MRGGTLKTGHSWHRKLRPHLPAVPPLSRLFAMFQNGTVAGRCARGRRANLEVGIPPDEPSGAKRQLQSETMRKKMTSVRGLVVERPAATSPKLGALDLLTRHAARAMSARVAMVVIADRDRRRVAASHGTEILVGIEGSVLSETCLREGGPMIVGDASREERFRADSLVTGALQTRFFGGRRLCLDDGTVVGALLVLDPAVRKASEVSAEMLEELGGLLESHFERTRHGLSPGELASAFPFAMVIDRGMRIVHGGRSLAKVCDGPVLGRSFADTFVVRQPEIPTAFDALAAARGQIIVLENVESRVVLRGSIASIGLGDTLMFLGTPRLTSAKDVTRLGLGAEDFALHDPALDMLAILEERARAIADLQELNVELMHAKARAEDATGATSTFLAHMSHELRTPMNAVLGMATLILDTDLSTAQRDYAETIRSSGESLLTVVNDVLDFSKIESGMMSIEEVAFSPVRVIDEALELVALPAARKRLDLAGWCEPGVPPWLLGDPTRIRQILLNLLSNAVKFTQSGHATVRASYDADVGMLDVTVEDTGIGMSKEVQVSIFEPFTQAESSTTRRFGGTGLGLTISRRLAGIMGGTLEVTSAVGKGSSFVLSLPCEEGNQPPGMDGPTLEAGWRAVVFDPSPLQARAIALRLVQLGAKVTRVATLDEMRAASAETGVRLIVAGAASHEEVAPVAEALRTLSAAPSILVAPPGGANEELPARIVRRPASLSNLSRAVGEMLRSRSASERLSAVTPDLPLSVLLVEDDLVNQRVASLLLARIGLRCDIAANGLQAIERVQAQRYDVVLMDMQMPELDGIEATRRIRALPVVQPTILALSASTLATERAACFDAGVDGFLPKPIDPEQLQATMAKLAARQPVGPKPTVMPPAPGALARQTLSLKNLRIARPPRAHAAKDVRTIENRKHPRKTVALAAGWSRPDGPRFEARCSDVSLGGCFLEVEPGAEFGADILVHLALPPAADGHAHAAVVPGTVRWTRPQGMGIQFGLMGARDTAALLKLLEG